MVKVLPVAQICPRRIPSMESNPFPPTSHVRIPILDLLASTTSPHDYAARHRASDFSHQVSHHTTLSLRGGASSRRLADDEHAPRLIWYLAGGCGKSPTGAQLRAWKRRDKEWRQKKEGERNGKKIGFWGEFGRALLQGRDMKKAKKVENGSAKAAVVNLPEAAT